MAKNPLGKIKDLTKGAASVGLHVAGQATKSATTFTVGAVNKLVQGRKLTIKPVPVAPESTKPAPAAKPAAKQTAPTKVAPSPEPVTSIDATADTAHVDVTPADIAKKVARRAPSRPAAKKAPARKTSPGAKLPPRKKVDESQQAESASAADKG